MQATIISIDPPLRLLIFLGQKNGSKSGNIALLIVLS